jgi:hypothetical protein
MTRSRHWPIAIFCSLLALVFVWGCGGGGKQPPSDATAVSPATKHESGATIVINTDTDPTKNPFPRTCTLSHGNKPDEDHVRWQNLSGKKVTITFAAWPFMEPKQDIVIDAGAYSAYYSLDMSLKMGPYTYESDLPFPSGGPGEPTIVDGP